MLQRVVLSKGKVLEEQQSCYSQTYGTDGANFAVKFDVSKHVLRVTTVFFFATFRKWRGESTLFR